MRPATLLFYAVVTFCLGSLTILAGGSRLLAQLFGADQIIQNGFATYPAEPWQSILLYATVGLSLFFVVLAFYYAASPGPQPATNHNHVLDEGPDMKPPHGR
jgi:hypothetical protein